MKVSFISNDNIACVEFDLNYKKAEAIITKLNLVAWDILERSKGKVLFQVEDEADFEDLKHWVNRLEKNGFYY